MSNFRGVATQGPTSCQGAPPRVDGPGQEAAEVVRVHRQPEHARGLLHCRQRLARVEGRRRRSASTACGRLRQHQRRVQVAGVGRPSARCSRIWRGVLSARSPPRTTCVMPWVGVVHHHRELVGPQAVGALAARSRRRPASRSALRTEASVMSRRSPGRCRLPGCSAAAAPGRACRAGPAGRCPGRPARRGRGAPGRGPATPARCRGASSCRETSAGAASAVAAWPTGRGRGAATATPPGRRRSVRSSASCSRMNSSAPGTQRGMSTSSMRTSQRPP
jgi:hypothetical protein